MLAYQQVLGGPSRAPKLALNVQGCGYEGVSRHALQHFSLHASIGSSEASHARERLPVVRRSLFSADRGKVVPADAAGVAGVKQIAPACLLQVRGLLSFHRSSWHKNVPSV
jgi:hypothetical protein